MDILILQGILVFFSPQCEKKSISLIHMQKTKPISILWKGAYYTISLAEKGFLEGENKSIPFQLMG